MERKKILVAVTGMTPQILTETLFALCTAKPAWIPEQIVVLTTLLGKKLIVEQLLGENGYFTRLQKEYALPQIDFSAQTIRVISKDGIDLMDIRSPEENKAAANLIVREISALCSDDETELHVSIAGGRKSMGFYIGYALSLFGRAQDRMSHVLVEEAFEQSREFFYPPKVSTVLNTGHGMLDASKAKVMLADIPFVRMRNAQVNNFLNTQESFSQAVDNVQKLFQKTIVYFNTQTFEVRFGDFPPVQFNAQLFCLYLAAAKYCAQGKEIIFTERGVEEKGFSEIYYVLHQKLSSRAEQSTILKELKDGGMKRIVQEGRSKIQNLLKKSFGDCADKFLIKSIKKEKRDVEKYGKNFYYLNISQRDIWIDDEKLTKNES